MKKKKKKKKKKNRPIAIELCVVSGAHPMLREQPTI